MRPVLLTMSAFGPYLEKTVIDFEKLGAAGVYLITGDTGSGKTTIFDAISFALFGEASGGIRSGAMLRSASAEPDVPTFVELTFENAGKTYTVKRNPEYFRLKTRGEGLTKEAGSAELSLTDGRVITKSTEVTAEIIEIIGVDKNQFSQIAMIAQGDFAKVILASTDERKAIFRRLFHTEKYNALQEKLKSLYSATDAEYKALSRSVTQFAGEIDCDENDPLSIMVEKARADRLAPEDTISLLEKLISQDDSRAEKIKAEIEKADKNLKKQNNLLTKAHTLKTARESLEKAQSELAEKTGRKTLLEKAYKDAGERSPEAKKMTDAAARLRAQLGDYAELDAEKEGLAALENTIKTLIRKAENERNALNKQAQKLTSDKTELTGLSDAPEKKAKLQAQKEKLSKKQEAIGAILDELDEEEELQSALVSAQEAYQTASSDYDTKNADYEAKNKAYLDGQAGIIAQTLTDGVPCPVCGSASHPHPAQPLKDAPTKEQLETAKNAAENARKTCTEAAEKASGIRVSAEQKRTAITKTAAKELKTEDFDQIKSAAQEKLRETQDALEAVDADLEAINKQLTRKNELEQIIPQAENALTTAKDALTLTEKTLAEKHVSHGGAQKRIFALSSKLEYESADAAREAAEKLEKDAAAITAAIENAKNELNTCISKIDGLNTVIDQNKKILEEKTEYDEEAIAEIIRELEGGIEELSSEKDTLTLRISTNRRLLASIKEKAEQSDAVGKKLTAIKALYETAAGNLSGKEKIMLETYVQTAYFDRIIARANLRLLAMTGGQYEFRRSTEAGNIRSQSGLELDVIDHANGTLRSVRSLSGGESFEASLSLALGLSDEVQSSAGGIRMDTMFVDEGFGTLSEDDLSQALQVLLSLAEGNKLIGIISHVAMLKEKIDRQIVITKTKAGSTARIVI